MNNHYFQAFKKNSPGLFDTSPIAPDVSLEVIGNEISIQIPFPSTHNIFYRFVREGLLISTDMRRLYRTRDSLDSAGISSLLILGASIPPLTPYREIRALKPGFRHTFDIEAQTLKSNLFVDWSSEINEDSSCDIDKQADIVARVLDKTLQDLCLTKNPIVLFSGGVDSSLLASRISSMEWNEASFLHCSFGESDPETLIARKIADELGISLDVSTWDIERGYESLDRAATIYSLPFCDHSCVPTHSLSIDLITKYESNRVVFDGIGADADFGFFGQVLKTKKLYNIPMPIRRAFGSIYGLLDLWEQENALEYYSRLMKRSTTLSELLFFFGQNPLLGIAYYVDSNDLQTITSCCYDSVIQIAQSRCTTKIIPLIVIGLIAPWSGVQKNKDLLLEHSFIPRYPFLECEIVDLALTRARVWPGNTGEKEVLKQLLSRSISKEYIYRKKSGLTAPPKEQFAHPKLIQHFDAVIDSNGPLHEFINISLVRKLINDVAYKRTLAPQTYNFIWAITFLSAWLSQVRFLSREFTVDFLQNTTSSALASKPIQNE